MATKERVIFIVDDDPVNSQRLRDHLHTNLKAKITTYPTGEDVLNNLDQKPDVVIVDYYLNSINQQAINGIEVLQKIKNKSPGTEVIMLSGQDKIDVAVEAAKHGSYDYVVKNESGFHRAENITHNIFRNLQLQDMLKTYRTAFYILLAVFILVIAVAVFLWSEGYLYIADVAP